MMQWGKITRNSATNLTVSFPLACTTAYSVVTTYCDIEKATAEYSIILLNVSGSSFTIYFDPEGGARSEFVYWMMVGQQQWGVCSANAIVAFPIAVASAYVVITTSYAANWGYVTNITTTSFKNANNANARYIAIGKEQQWSVNGEPLDAAYGTWTFPIAFSSKNYWTFSSFNTLTGRTGNYYGFFTAGTKTKYSCAYCIDLPQCDILAIGY